MNQDQSLTNQATPGSGCASWTDCNCAADETGSLNAEYRSAQMTPALRSLRSRRAILGLSLATATAVAVIAACVLLLEPGIRGGTTAERLAGSDIVVASRQSMTADRLTGASGSAPSDAVPERGRLDQTAVDEVSGADDVGSTSWGRPWSSATIAPFLLVVAIVFLLVAVSDRRAQSRSGTASRRSDRETRSATQNHACGVAGCQATRAASPRFPEPCTNRSPVALSFSR
jgi:hypothetical protein